jgi:hypothetical protein
MTAMTDRSPQSGRAFGLDVAVGRLTPAERAERGKAARAALPREGHAVFDPPADRRAGVSIHVPPTPVVGNGQMTPER